MICDKRHKPNSIDEIIAECFFLGLLIKYIDKFANAKEKVNEYWPAKEEAKLPPKIVKDSVSKNIKPPAKPI